MLKSAEALQDVPDIGIKAGDELPCLEHTVRLSSYAPFAALLQFQPWEVLTKQWGAAQGPSEGVKNVPGAPICIATDVNPPEHRQA